jgi:hypothetical protein
MPLIGLFVENDITTMKYEFIYRPVILHYCCAIHRLFVNTSETVV